MKRLQTVALAVIVLLLAQGLRLQVAAGSLFRREAEGNRVHELVTYAPRGIFLDRFGTPLVRNVPAIQLTVEPADLPDDLESVYGTLAEALPTRDLTAVRERLMHLDPTTQTATLLLRGLTHQEFLAVAARADRLPGIRLETAAVRDYVGNGPFAHVLGYTGKISPEDRAQYPTYLLTEDIGIAGLERQYERLLRGRHGARRVEIDAFGTVQHDLGTIEPIPGANLRLHLDAGLQQHAAEALARGLEAADVRRGSIVALDPFSGAVRALVSFPTFPHSDFSHGPEVETVRAVFDDPAGPLLNRAVQGQYVPGSSFKIAVSVAALEEGIASPNLTIDSTGGIRVGQWFFPDWKAGGHGPTDLTKALAESVNTYFYTIGGGVGDRPGLGIERMTAWARRLGIGEPTGIDLPDEATGFLPSPEWKEQEKREAWYIGDTYHAAIGQGDVLLTPLQLAVAAAAVVNGGTLHAPRLLDAIEDADGNVRERVPPVTTAEGILRPETAAAVRAGMRAAVTDGSARGLATLPVTAAAKTGTAQVGGTEKTHAWVTVAAPAEQPELVLVALLEHGGGGDVAAVPVAREILAWYFATEQRATRARGPLTPP